MEDYKPNSYKSKEQPQPIVEKKVEKVTTGKVMTKKKSGIAKAAKMFFAEDICSVKRYVIMEVLLPALKRTFLDMVNNGADMLVNGEITRSKSNTPGSKVSYRSFYDRRDDPPRARIDSRYGSAYDYDELAFETRGDAESVLVTLDEIMDTYKMVKVADLYDASGRTPSSVMYNYGWTDIHTASVIRTVDGYYMIRLPRALPLD